MSGTRGVEYQHLLNQFEIAVKAYNANKQQYDEATIKNIDGNSFKTMRTQAMDYFKNISKAQKPPSSANPAYTAVMKNFITSIGVSAQTVEVTAQTVEVRAETGRKRTIDAVVDLPDLGVFSRTPSNIEMFEHLNKLGRTASRESKCSVMTNNGVSISRENSLDSIGSSGLFSVPSSPRRGTSVDANSSRQWSPRIPTISFKEFLENHIF